MSQLITPRSAHQHSFERNREIDSKEGHANCQNNRKMRKAFNYIEDEMDIDFLIFYEVKTRELDCVALIRNELVARGYTVEVLCFAEAYDMNRFTRFRNRVKVALMPSLYHTDEIMHHVYLAAGRVKQIVNLQWEQVWSLATEKDLKAYSYPKGEAKKAFHVCWGEKERDNLMRAGIDGQKLLLTGPVHMDFYRDELKSRCRLDQNILADYDLDVSRKLVLFVSSFVFNHSFSGRDQLSLDLREMSYLKMLEWMERLLVDEGGEIDLVYRPHPVEMDNPLLAELDSRFERFHVVSDGTIKEWLGISDRVCTWVSTSLADMYYSGIPYAILRPVNLDDNYEMASYKNALPITEYSDFKDFIDLGFAGRSANSSTIKGYYDVSISESSTKRLCDSLEDLIESGEQFDWDAGITDSFDRNFCYRLLKKRFRGLLFCVLRRINPLLERVDPHKRFGLARYSYQFGQQWLDNIASQDELDEVYGRWLIQ